MDYEGHVLCYVVNRKVLNQNMFYSFDSSESPPFCLDDSFAILPISFMRSNSPQTISIGFRSDDWGGHAI